MIATGAVGRTPQPGGWHWKGCVAMTGSRTCSIHIDASPGAAFALMRDPGCYDEFMPGVRFTPRAITQGGVGTTFDFETRVAGVPFHGAVTFTQFEVDRHIRSDSSVPIEGDFEMRFAEEGDGVRVTIEHHPGHGWGVPVIGRFLAESYAKDDQRWLELLKRRLEGPNAGLRKDCSDADRSGQADLGGPAGPGVRQGRAAQPRRGLPGRRSDARPAARRRRAGRRLRAWAFLATHARVARSVAGLDASRTMVGAAQSRLADRITAGTARVLLGDSATVCRSAIRRSPRSP